MLPRDQGDVNRPIVTNDLSLSSGSSTSHIPNVNEAVTNQVSPLPEFSSPSSRFRDTVTQSHRPAISKNRLTLVSQLPQLQLLPADIVFADYLVRSNRQMIWYPPGVQQPRWQDWTWSRLRFPQFQGSDPDLPNDAGDSEQLQAYDDGMVSLRLLP